MTPPILWGLLAAVLAASVLLELFVRWSRAETRLCAAEAALRSADRRNDALRSALLRAYEDLISTAGITAFSEDTRRPFTLRHPSLGQVGYALERA